LKLRIERSGYHFFDRISGLHILFDEERPDADCVSMAPRSLSIALSNACDLKCHFCYREKNGAKLDERSIMQMAAVADELGCLEVTFGGGEPLLYRGLTTLCSWIWSNTALGISITTHGHRLTEALISGLEGKISSLRFSIDGGEPYYGRIRGRPLKDLLLRIEAVVGRIPFGINAVVSPGHTAELRCVAELAVQIGAMNLLIIPQHHQGQILLSEDEWRELNDVVRDYESRLPLLVTASAASSILTGLLSTEREDEFLYAHISADGKLKANSYTADGLAIDDVSRLGTRFEQLQQSLYKGVV